MPSDTDDDILAARWRDGLRTLAQPGDPTTVAGRVRVRVRARRHRRLIVAGAAAVIAIVGIAGGALALSHSTPNTPNLRAGAPSPPRPAPGHFQIRPVLAIGAPPCRADQLPGRGQRGVTCYSLGPVTVDGSDVSSVTVSARPEDGIGVDLIIRGEAFAQLNMVAARGYGQASPLNAIALVVDGYVVSAPRLNQPIFPNSELRFAGLIDGDAQRIAAAIGTPAPVPGASTARMRATLGLWSSFPVGITPRPLLVLPGRDIVDPSRGFRDNATKEAYLAGSFVPPTSFPSAPANADGYPLISARDAFAALKAGGRSPPAPTSLSVTGIKLGTAAFATDRGLQALPAWLFSLRSVADPAAVLATAPSTRFVPTGLDQFAPVGGSNRSIMSTGSARTSADGTTITLTFVGGPAGTGPCTNDYQARVMESGTAVAVTVAETRGVTGTELCSDVGYSRQTTITLAAPLRSRVLIDGMTGQAVAVIP